MNVEYLGFQRFPDCEAVQGARDGLMIKPTWGISTTPMTSGWVKRSPRFWVVNA